MLFIIVTVAALMLLFLSRLERERQRRAKHRAKTQRLLAYINHLPFQRSLELNLQASWQG